MSSEPTDLGLINRDARVFQAGYDEGYRQGFKEATEQALAILTKHFPQFDKPSEKPL